MGRELKKYHVVRSIHDKACAIAIGKQWIIHLKEGTLFNEQNIDNFINETNMALQRVKEQEIDIQVLHEELADAWKRVEELEADAAHLKQTIANLNTEVERLGRIPQDAMLENVQLMAENSLLQKALKEKTT